MTTFCGPDGVAYSSVTHSWETPPDFFEVLNKEFKFGLDAAATKKNALCKRFLTAKDDALTADWAKASRGKPAFCNPPYGRGLKRWAHTLIEQSANIVIAALVPARTDTQFFEMLHDAGEIRLLRGRLGFYLKGEPVFLRTKAGKLARAMAPFPSMIWVNGPRKVPAMFEPGRITLWGWKEET